MEPWYVTLIKILVLIPLKILELVLNSFAFIIWAIMAPFIKIVSIIKGTDKKQTK